MLKAMLLILDLQQRNVTSHYPLPASTNWLIAFLLEVKQNTLTVPDEVRQW
jgi:hypothetical protein